MEMVKSVWLVIYVITVCKFLQCDARQNKQSKVVQFYDDNNNLHLINLAIPEIHKFLYILSIRKLEADARFWLYTRKNVNNYEELHIDHLNNHTLFDPVKPLIVVTHGWLSSGFSNSTQWIKDAFLDARDVNVVVVDWETDAQKGYLMSAHSTNLVAKQISDLIMALSKRYRFRGRSTHLIGHSLGAHVAGLAGIKLRRRGFIVGYVTGLDPARPFFEHPRIFPTITKKSARFVDIIHTNVGVLGFKSRIGHIDFYPNGGHQQPHCCPMSQVLSCEHTCSYIYFQEAIRGRNYLSTRCDSYISYLNGFCKNNDKQIMGLSKTDARGSYYLNIPY